MAVELPAAAPAPGQFEFGLEPADENRAQRLHEECLIFDAINQHPGGANIFDELPANDVAEIVQGAAGMAGIDAARELPYRLAANGASDAIRRWWKASGIDVGTIGVPIHRDTSGDRFEHLMALYAELGWLRLALSADEILSNRADGVISLWGYEQPVGGIPPELELVEMAHARGLRTLMLTYNRQDFVGHGCTERIDAGLSMFGVEVVSLCNALGIIVDTSHCGTQTTLDACEYSSRPVIANHSGAKGIFDHARNKSDAELDAIAASGGLVGVVTVPFFLSGARQPTITTLLDHIDYLVDRIGVEHVGIGTDWPLQGPREVISKTLGPLLGKIGFRPEDRVSATQTLVGFDDYRDMPNITRGLVARGYSDDDIAAILGGNNLRVIRAVCG